MPLGVVCKLFLGRGAPPRKSVPAINVYKFILDNFQLQDPSMSGSFCAFTD